MCKSFVCIYMWVYTHVYRICITLWSKEIYLCLYTFTVNQCNKFIHANTIIFARVYVVHSHTYEENMYICEHMCAPASKRGPSPSQ